MKNALSYLQPLLKVLAFFGCYIFLMAFSAAFLVPLLGRIDPSVLTPAELDAMQSSPALLLLMQLASMIGLMLTLFFFSKLPPKKDYISLGLTGEHVLKDIGLGALAGTIIILLAFLVLWITGTVSSLELNEAFSARELLLWFGIYLIVAFVEEVMFRGYFLNVFMERYTPFAAVLMSSLFFAFMHLLNPSFGWLGFLNIALAGVLMGLLFFYRGNIWLPVGLHFGWNFVQGTVLGFNVSGIDAENILSLQLKGSELISGGEFGLEGSLVTTLVCLCAIILLYFSGKLVFQPLEFDEHEPD
ncbi:hypothetical protein EDD80_105129 [Anseongella ginsenosidimutans]|uniref:CAAX prenyl protease 2/Lysostaphin resistance protein A-like domain-containing protein n=1 Tax=Anseongella ginsenosidimutans TaxID=496056 RepID=A0A4R3KU35_9SPHI|nr:type II CAAX endopeptidase family protein [Anseongella ginsenosidimutans]QEC52922.1 CPBP family intramembrane metalloprotease [Anseongella ginsenosidimutans]TCS87315.1 hypothetical protein EDD80_105129 [Anseongella ginsenosidimutans]